MTDTMPLLVSPAEAARRLGLDQVSKSPERLVLEMARRGELRAKKVGRWLMIDAESLESFARER